MLQTVERSRLLALLDELIRIADIKLALRSDTPGSVKAITSIQLMCELKFADEFLSSIHRVVIEHALLSERMGPDSFIDCIRLTREKLAMLDDRQLPDDANDYLVISAGHPMQRHFVDIINTHIHAQHIRDLVSSAIELAGFAGRIAVEKSSTSNSVELVNGYTFRCKNVFNTRLRLESPYIVCVDGFVESVSELDRLFNDAARVQCPVVVFTRGMSDDVKHTIRVNNDRGSFRVHPFEVAFDLNGINTLKDMSIVTSSPLVSSATGDVISTVSLETHAATISSATLRHDSVCLVSRNTMRSVAAHVTFLREKRANERIDDVAALLDERIKSLSPNHVIIRLLDDINYIKHAQEIDNTLRSFNKTIAYGIDATGMKPMITGLAANLYSTRCVQALSTLGAII